MEHVVEFELTDASGNKVKKKWQWEVDVTPPEADFFFPGRPTNENPMQASINFSEPCDNIQSAPESIWSGVLVKATKLRPDPDDLTNRKYLVEYLGQNVSDGIVTASVAGGMCVDLAGNANTGSSPATTFYDGTPPKVTLFQGPLKNRMLFNRRDMTIFKDPDGEDVLRTNKKDSFPLLVTFDEPVIKSKTVEAVESTGPGERSLAAAPVTYPPNIPSKLVTGGVEGSSLKGFETWRVNVAFSADGIYTIGVTDAAAQDGAKNTNVATGENAAVAVTVDTVAPTVKVTSVQGSSKRVYPGDGNSAALVFTITFSEPVLDLRNVWNSVDVTGANLTERAQLQSTTSCDPACSEYRLLVTGNADEDVVVRVPAGITADLANNLNLESEEARIELYVLDAAVESAAAAASASFGATVIATATANVAASVATSAGMGGVGGAVGGGGAGAGALALAGQLRARTFPANTA